MHIIQPCCAQRQLADLRKAIAGGGTEQIRCYGDMSLTELLPALLTRYNETELLIAAPSIPDQAADIIARWARHQWARVDGSGNFYALRHMTLIADLSAELSPMASEWLKENPFGDRLTIINRQLDDTAILLPDFAITGPVNLRYGDNFTATVTTEPERVNGLWNTFLVMTREPDKKEEVTGTVEEPAAEGSVGPAKKRRMSIK